MVGQKRAIAKKFEVSQELLQRLAGRSAAIAGMQPSMFERRALIHTLQSRMTKLGMDDPELYLEAHDESCEEQASFLEGVLIGETSFFRDGAVFAEMSRWGLQWFANHKRPMRILSAPCSTGEEPYSIAAMLERDGIAPDRFSIEALDISGAAILHARAAIYKGFSLRNIPHPETSSFLESVGDGWQVTQTVRDCVDFRQANLLDDAVLTPRTYDLICSRNLLLYQNPNARRNVALTLANALQPKGRLILGAADWGRDLDELFRLEEPVHSFALRLNLEATISVSPASVGKAVKAAPATNTRTVTKKVASTTTDSVSQQLADVSNLYRIALEHHLRGDERHAEKLCRQTLYLEPDHIPSMELLVRMKRPHATPRMQLALHARLKRHRDSNGKGVLREHN